jgi:hypothetical protein
MKRTPPAIPNERGDGRPIGARRGRVEDGRGRDGKAWPQYTVPDEPRQSSAVSAFLTPDDGSRRATGRPRSTIDTASPPLRPSIKALKPFFV